LKAEPEERTNPWDHAGYHIQAEHDAYDAEINGRAETTSTTLNQGAKKNPLNEEHT